MPFVAYPSTRSFYACLQQPMSLLAAHPCCSVRPLGPLQRLLLSTVEQLEAPATHGRRNSFPAFLPFHSLERDLVLRRF